MGVILLLLIISLFLIACLVTGLPVLLIWISKNAILRWTGFLILLAIGYAGFSIMSRMTLSASSRLSNGNPALLFLMLLFVPLLTLAVVVAYHSYRFLQTRHRLPMTCGFIILLLVSITFLWLRLRARGIHYVNDHLGGLPSNPASVIFNKGWFNEYTYNLFFNGYSYILCICIFLLAGSLMAVSRVLNRNLNGHAAK